MRGRWRRDLKAETRDPDAFYSLIHLPLRSTQVHHWVGSSKGPKMKSKDAGEHWLLLCKSFFPKKAQASVVNINVVFQRLQCSLSRCWLHNKEESRELTQHFCAIYTQDNSRRSAVPTGSQYVHARLQTHTQTHKHTHTHTQIQTLSHPLPFGTLTLDCSWTLHHMTVT